MATAPALMTIEQYLHAGFSPDVDFIDGELRERHVGEFDHGHLQVLISAWFLQRMPQLRLIPATELRIRVSDTRVRICDVGAVRQETQREQVATKPPAVCIEVLSPEDRLNRAEAVLIDYLTMGVENIWLIDPVRRAAYAFDGNGLRHVPDNVLTIKGTTHSLAMDELFTALDNLNA